VSAVQVRHAQLRALADDYWAFFLRENPEYATALGEYEYNDRLTNYSLAHVEEVRAQTARLLQRARGIDPTGLADTDRLDHSLLVRTLTDRLEAIRLGNHLMVIDQMNGVHLALPQIASYAPFGTVQHYRDYVARLNAIPAAIDQIIERSRAGLQEGLMQPRFLLEKAAVQSATLADAAGTSSPFATPAASIPDAIPAADREQLRADILAAVDGKVRPAYARLRTFLAEEYAPKGRAEFGVWSLPDGDARYRYAIRAQTTTRSTKSGSRRSPTSRNRSRRWQSPRALPTAGVSRRPCSQTLRCAAPRASRCWTATRASSARWSPGCRSCSGRCPGARWS
jgi:uncharacterized protein (DUF885 family)